VSSRELSNEEMNVEGEDEEGMKAMRREVP
jgi:hypothetical protein